MTQNEHNTALVHRLEDLAKRNRLLLPEAQLVYLPGHVKDNAPPTVKLYHGGGERYLAPERNWLPVFRLGTTGRQAEDTLNALVRLMETMEHARLAG